MVPVKIQHRRWAEGERDTGTARRGARGRGERSLAVNMWHQTLSLIVKEKRAETEGK